MIALLLPLWMKFREYIIAAGVFLGLVAGIYLKGYSDSSSKQKAVVEAQRAKDLDLKQEVHEEVSNMSGTQLDTELSRWMRDK